MENKGIRYWLALLLLIIGGVTLALAQYNCIMGR